MIEGELALLIGSQTDGLSGTNSIRGKWQGRGRESFSSSLDKCPIEYSYVGRGTSDMLSYLRLCTRIERCEEQLAYIRAASIAVGETLRTTSLRTSPLLSAFSRAHERQSCLPDARCACDVEQEPKRSSGSILVEPAGDPGFESRRFAEILRTYNQWACSGH